MRTIVGTKRIVDQNGVEDWVDWVVRSTREVERVMSDLAVPDWVEEVHRRSFRWAGRCARAADERWTREVLVWSAAGARKRGRPKFRWTDRLNQFLQQGRQATNEFWLGLANDEESWATLEDEYVNFALGKLSEA